MGDFALRAAGKVVSIAFIVEEMMDFLWRISSSVL